MTGATRVGPALVAVALAVGATACGAGPPPGELALVQRGEVVQVRPVAAGSGGTAVRVRGVDGAEQTYVLDARAVVRGVAGGAGALAPGDRVRVLATADGVVRQVQERRRRPERPPLDPGPAPQRAPLDPRLTPQGAPPDPRLVPPGMIVP